MNPEPVFGNGPGDVVSYQPSRFFSKPLKNGPGGAAALAGTGAAKTAVSRDITVSNRSQLFISILHFDVTAIERERID